MQSTVGSRGQIDGYCGFGFYRAAVEDDPHDAGYGSFLAAGTAAEDGLHQARMEAIHLDAGCTETCQLDDRRGAQVEASRLGQVKEIEVRDCDVFAHLTGCEKEAELAKVVEQANLKKVHLREIGLGGIAASEIAMLYGRPAVRISTDAKAG